MEKIQKISMIGMGAVGCAYGKNLYDLNPENFKVIASGERKNRYEKNGFVINGKHYKFKCISSDEKCEKDDLVIIAVKENQLQKAIEEIKNHVGKKTIILSLLNGITSEEKVGKVYGMGKMLYSYCLIDAMRNGNEVQVLGKYKIVFGEKDNHAYSEKVEAVKELFSRAKINYDVPENMLRSMWTKFMMNVGINPLSALLRANYGVFQKNKYAREIMISAMREVVKLSKKAGINLDENDIEGCVKVLDNCSADGKTSMYQDILAGRKTEVDIFSGAVCELGLKYGVDTPVNRTIFNMVKVIE